MSDQADYRHFSLEPLADGVWAALHKDGGWAVANAGIVDLGGATLVFDSFITPEAGLELRTAARALTGREPACVVASHYHNDHIRGSQAFEGAVLVATHETRRLIDTLGREELESDRAQARAQLEAAQRMLESGAPEVRRNAVHMVPYWAGIVASLPEAEVRLPDLGFDGELTFHGSRRAARLLALGGGHTQDDSVLLLPDDGVLFASDLLFVDFHPYLADGNPEGWLEILSRLRRLPASVFVPGHGPVAGAESLDDLEEYIVRAIAEAERRAAAGETAADVADAAIPEAYRTWLFGFPFYRANLRFLLGRGALGDGA